MKAEFIVHLAMGVDPNKIVLYQLKRKNDKRTIRFGISGLLEGAMPTRATKWREFSYEITPDQDLAPREYCFSTVGSNDVFAFGIDGLQQKRKH